MCGRFALSMVPALFQELFGVAAPEGYRTRWNITPDSAIAVVRVPPDAGREAAMLRWGILGPWMKEADDRGRQINARAETAGQKPTFRDAYKKGRCLIPADGFYEWQKAEGGHKQPWLVTGRDGAPLAFAGLWRRNRLTSGELLDSCAILTMEAFPAIHPIHHRMPVMLDPARWDDWLDPAFTEPPMIAEILEPLPESELAFWEVGRAVGNPRNDGPELTRPLAELLPTPTGTAQGSLL